MPWRLGVSSSDTADGHASAHKTEQNGGVFCRWRNTVYAGFLGPFARFERQNRVVL